MFNLSATAIPERFARLLDITDKTLAEMLLNCQFLHSCIDIAINSRLSTLPNMTGNLPNDLCTYVLHASIDDLHELSRIATLLINQKAVRASMNSADLLAFAQWCGTAAPFSLIKENTLPKLPSSFTLSEISIETLSLFAEHVFNLILGVVPHGVSERFQLRCVTNLSPLPFPGEPEHQTMFEAYCLRSIDIFMSARGQHATH